MFFSNSLSCYPAICLDHNMQTWRLLKVAFFCFFSHSHHQKKNVKANKQPGLVPSAGLPSLHRKPPRRSFPTHPTHPASSFPATSSMPSDWMTNNRSSRFTEKKISGLGLNFFTPMKFANFMTTTRNPGTTVTVFKRSLLYSIQIGSLLRC